MTVSTGRIKDIANILKLGHIEFRTTDLVRAREFYVDLIGLHETGRDENRIYLRCTEDRQHHTFVLRQADAAGVGTIGFRVAAEDDLDRMKARFEALGLPVRWAGNDMLGQGRTLRMQDPLGFTIDYYAEVATVPWLVQQYHLHKGPSPTRIDHVNVLTPDAQAGYDWYTQELGFGCAEYTESEPPDPRIWASWLFRKATVHDIAVMTGAVPPRIMSAFRCRIRCRSSRPATCSQVPVTPIISNAGRRATAFPMRCSCISGIPTATASSSTPATI
jgi:catechol 2,3-dioxygenase